MSEEKRKKTMTIDEIEDYERKANVKLVKRKIRMNGKWIEAPLYGTRRKAKLRYGKGKLSMSAEFDMGEWG